jgi:hypothetical protein
MRHYVEPQKKLTSGPDWIFAFRSAKAHPFAERKATLNSAVPLSHL